MMNTLPAPTLKPRMAGTWEDLGMGFGKYLVGAISFGFAGAKVGVAAFGTAFSGVIPAAAVGLLAVKAFAGAPASTAEASNELIRKHLAEQAKPSKKPPRKRVVKTGVVKLPAPRKVTRKKALP